MYWEFYVINSLKYAYSRYSSFCPIYATLTINMKYRTIFNDEKLYHYTSKVLLDCRPYVQSRILKGILLCKARV